MALLLAGLWPGGVSPATAQDPALYELNIKEIYSQAAYNIQSRRFAQAVPFLKEVIQRLPDPEEQALKRLVEYAIFHLPVCYVEMDRLDRALDGFEAYLSRYPAGLHIVQVLILKAEVHAAQQSWPEVISTTETVLKNPSLRRDQQVTAWFLNGEAHYRSEQWREALNPLIFVFDKGRDRDLRSQAGVMASVSLIKLERFPELFRFLPLVYQTPARFDIELNMALIIGGDARFEDDDYPNAVLLFRPVYFKSELLESFKRRLENLKNSKERAFASGQEIAVISRMRRRVDRMVESFEQQRKQILEYPEYDQQLVLRLAETHYQLMRYWEALLQYRSLYDRWPEHELAEEALYYGFATSLDLEEPTRIFKEGYDYLEAYPGGEFYEIVSVTLAQIHVSRKEWRRCINLGIDALEVVPKHEMRAELDFLMGYSHFQEEELEEALGRFAEIQERFPQSRLREDADYWHPLTLLFLNRYPETRAGFTAFTARYHEGNYLEDATYRRGVAEYGDDDFAAAAETFKAFMREYPDSVQYAEASCMLGDIYASWTQLDEALEAYQEAIDSAGTMVHVNYGIFQSVRVFELEGRHKEIVTLCRDYLSEYGDEANISHAVYWIGTSQMRMGDDLAAYQTFMDAIGDYGNGQREYGIDRIIRDLIATPPHLAGTGAGRAFMENLYAQLADSRAKNEKTRELRLVALFAELESDPIQRGKLMSVLVQERLIDKAAPITLATMGREAVRQGKMDLARAVYKRFLDVHAKSDFASAAYFGLAELELEIGNHVVARHLFQSVVDRFPNDPLAGQSMKRIGDSLRAEEKHDAAVAAYSTVLSVRDWKGPLWPESLYWTGECLRLQGKTEEAFAYFQRIYVLYESSVDWMAKAYLRSAACLLDLNRRDEAITTYEEMLSREELAERKEAEVAREQLGKLGVTS